MNAPHRTPPGPAISGRARWWAMAALSLSLLTVNVDYTVVNVALSEIARELGADASQQQWIVNAYILVFAGLLLSAGALADRRGRKGALQAGLLVVVLASVFGATAGSPTQLIVARALMGVGAAFVMPTTLSLVRTMFPEPAELAKAIGIWTAIAGIGSALGPVVGGLLVDSFGWAGVFWVNVPVLLISFTAVALLVPTSRAAEAQRPDLPGGVLSAGAFALLIWGIVDGAQHGWTGGRSVTLVVGGIVLLALFTLWELRTPQPMLDVRVFRGNRLTPAVLVVATGFVALGGSIFLITQYMQFVLGFSALEAGLGILPLAIGLAIAGPLSTRLSARYGVRPIIMLGLSLVATGLAVQALWADGTSYPPTAVGLLLAALGVGLSAALSTRVVVSSLPPAKAGVASAVNNLTHELSVAIGVSLFGSVLAVAYQDRIDGALDRLGVTGADAGDAADNVGGALDTATRIGGDTGAALTDSARQAFTDSMHLGLWVGAAAAVVGVLLALRLSSTAVAAVDQKVVIAAEEKERVSSSVPG